MMCRTQCQSEHETLVLQQHECQDSLEQSTVDPVKLTGIIGLVILGSWKIRMNVEALFGRKFHGSKMHTRSTLEQPSSVEEHLKNLTSCLCFPACVIVCPVLILFTCPLLSFPSAYSHCVLPLLDRVCTPVLRAASFFRIPACVPRAFAVCL